MTIQKIKSGRVTSIDADQFVGPPGTLFFNEDQGDLRLGDGVTPGGILLAVGGGGGGGNYVLPTATTTIKGGVKIDGQTIVINNQQISVGSINYSSIINPPTLISDFTNDVGFITSSALSTYALSSSIPTNNNQLTNGAGYITTSALSGYATESYVTTRGYLTAVSWNDVSGKPTFATVATSGSYADLTNKPTLFSGSYNDLTNKPTLFSGSYNDLTNKPTIPTDINQLTDASGLLGQGGGGGGTTYITNTVENPYSFSVAADDSTLREISNGETLRFQGASNITVSSDAEGKITIAGPDLTGYATQSYVTSQGYITNNVTTLSSLTTVGELNGLTINDTGGGIIFTISGAGRPGNGNIQTWKFFTNTNIGGPGSYIEFPDGTLQTTAWTGTVSYNDLTDKPTLFSGSYTDLTNKPTIPTNTNELTNGAGFITSSALTGYATESYVTTRGYLTTVDYSIITNRPSLFSGSYNDLTDKPNIAGTYTWSIAADDSTQIEIGSGNLVKVVGAQGITTTSTADGQITITGPDLSNYALASSIPTNNNQLTNGAGYITTAVNANGTFSLPILSAEPINLQAGQIALANGTSWDPLDKAEGRLYTALYTGSGWIEIGGITENRVYGMILGG